jgi:RNA polymerase sigma-B factor
MSGDRVTATPNDVTDVTDDVTALFERYRTSGDRAVRNELVRRHVWLAERCARQYRDRGELLDDLVQVACLGLVKAVERYDPDRGPFVAFASPTIMGELKRHFRDATWAVAVPRRPKELRTRVSTANEALRHHLGRSPTVDEVAEFANLPKEHVIEALEAERVYRPLPFEVSMRAFEPRTRAEPDSRETSLLARDLMARLDDCEREIVYLTYFEGWTQREIGVRLGLGQVQVSRRLRAALDRLRAAANAARTSAA